MLSLREALLHLGRYTQELLSPHLQKAEQAFQKCKKPIIIEDDGLFIDSLNGFPGPYSSYVFKTIGNNGILQLLKHNRQAKFCSIIFYYDNKNSKSFEAKIDGTISKSQHGSGWGYDPIFIPKNFTKNYHIIFY